MVFDIDEIFNVPISDINNPIMLVGWPGIALVGKIAIETIKDSLEAELFRKIEYDDFPPKAIINQGNMLIPSAEIYYKPGDDNDLFLLTADFQPQTSQGIYDFCENLCEMMREITNGGMQMYISTGALVPEAIPEEVKVFVSGTDPDIVDGFLKIDNTKIMEGGIIAGMNGILPVYAGTKDYAPGICLLAEIIPVPMLPTDPKASKALVQVLKDYLNLAGISFEALDKKVNELEKIISSIKSRVVQDFGKQGEGDNSYFR